MFREMRREDRAVPDDVTREILAESEYGTLATVNTDGYPYTTPVSFVWFGDCIYFHCARQGQKLDNIMRDGRVCFSAVTDTQVLPGELTTRYKSAVVFGSAELVDGDEKRIALVQLVQKYSPQFLAEGKKCITQTGGDTAMVRITPTHITGKAYT